MNRSMLLLALVSLACGRNDAPKPDPVASATAPASPSSTAPATASAAASVAASASVTAPSSAVASAARAPALATTASATTTTTTTAATASSTPLPPGVGMHLDGAHWSLDVPAPTACDKGAPCKLTVRITAKDDFHVNKDYPYKLAMDAAPGADFLGTDAAGASTFTKAAGDFTVDAEKTGTMTVKFRPSAGGALALGGEMRLSVCNASNCMLDKARVTATVPVR